MSAISNTATGMSRVLAHVRLLTWVPSTGGRVNTTDKHVIGVSVWVNSPGDDRYKPEDRGGEQAVAIAKRKLASEGIEWLALMGVELTDMPESMIVNQPKGLTGEFDMPDLGLRVV